jgi:diguanylate cyclase
MWSNSALPPLLPMSRPPPSPSPARTSPRRLGGSRFWPLSSRTLWVVTPALVACAGFVAWALVALLPGSDAPPAATAAVLGSLVALLPMALLLYRTVRDLEQGRHLAMASGALDPVTGVSRRDPFIGLAEREFSRSRRYGIGAALLLVDVDRFRRMVEGYDAEVGDLVLREVAASTQATLRGADALARFGHAQMAVFLAHADPLGALDVAERIRERIEGLEIVWRDQRLRATVSVGVVLMRPAHLSLQAVIDDAEAALGAARHAGGNCVRAAPVDPKRQAHAGPTGPSVDDNQAAGGGA